MKIDILIEAKTEIGKKALQKSYDNTQASRKIRYTLRTFGYQFVLYKTDPYTLRLYNKRNFSNPCMIDGIKHEIRTSCEEEGAEIDKDFIIKKFEE